MLRPACDQAGAELGQHAEVETGVGQLEAEGIFPVNARTHGVGSLTVAEVLEKLKHRHQRQPPRRKAGLPPLGIERAEVLVVVEGPELVA